MERLGIDYALVSDLGRIDKSGFLINYSEEDIHGSLQIVPQGLLNETGIRYLAFDLKEQEDAGILVKKPENHLYFDLFSAIFFIISRYEEYLNFAKDQHHRFKYEDSCLYQGQCLHLPLVDSWIQNFRKLLVSEFGFSETDFRRDEFHVKPTLDIDSVYTYKGRPFYRHLGAIVGDIFRLRFVEIIKRFKANLNMGADPNDNFDFQLEELKNKNLKATYFFQVGPYGTYDKNINPANRGFIEIIKKVQAAGHEIGLHPSYQSNSEIQAVLEEKKILESMTGQPVTKSRQHFLRFDLPRTFRHLADCGIREEYSMGYSDINGFRAGTAFPFHWFDLERNKVTTLRIVPFVMMDVAFKQFRKLSSDETMKQSGTTIETLKDLGAPFCFVFHNESLSGHRGWQGWGNVFKHWLNG